MFAGLNSEAYDRQYTDAQLVRRLASYLTPHKREARITVALILIITVIGLVDPLIISATLDAVGRNLGTTYARQIILGLMALKLTFSFLIWLANLGRRRSTARVVADVISKMREDAFARVIRHDLSFFDKHQSGRIISRISNDTQELSQTANILVDFVSSFATMIVLLIALAFISWQLTLVMIAMTPFVAGAGALFRKFARSMTRRGFQAIAEVNAAIQESVAGIRVAKNFRQELRMYGEFKRVNEQAYHANVRRGFVLSNVFPVLNSMAGIATGILVFSGGLVAAAGSITLGAWYLFVNSLDRFWFPLTNLASNWSQIQSGLSACERLFALMDAESNVKQLDERSGRFNRPERLDLTGEIEFKNVSFRYTEQTQVLDDFSLRIRAGESVAFVGHTGAGKSSIAKLIARFYEFQEGQILIDGRDIRTFDLQAYRRSLGIVSQSPFLFSGTVAENIRYARPNASDAEIEAIARRIGGGEWVDALPAGLITQVGERGGKLSMGQRQLVALMRVLVQHPPIFILDEATASVDPFTETQIQQALNLILKSSTSILIAHRLSTVKAVDRIIVLKNGRIIEEGNHDALMRGGGHYAELYETYFRHQFVAG